MKVGRVTKESKYFLGLNNQDASPIQVGYVTKAQIQRHYHLKVHEFWLVCAGELEMDVSDVRIILKKGEVAWVEPREVHEIVAASDDIAYFIIKYPPIQDDKVIC